MLVRLYKNDASIKGECVVYYDVENNKFYVPAGQAYTYTLSGLQESRYDACSCG